MAEFQGKQQHTSREILDLSRDSSKWEVRNILKRVPGNLDSVRQRFAKDSEKDEISTVFEYEDEEEKTKAAPWKWMSRK